MTRIQTPTVLHHLISLSADRYPDRPALSYKGETWDYARLNQGMNQFAGGLRRRGVGRAERVGIFLEKCFENVVACFGAARGGQVFVPINPLLKPEQVGHILRDCSVRVLVTSASRRTFLSDVLGHCPELRSVVVVDSPSGTGGVGWEEWNSCPALDSQPLVTETDMAAILYTSGSTGKPKGVVLSHRNLVAGAVSVASYLENVPDDVIVSALPLSFDAGFSQLTTAFHVGARVVLINYLLPRDVMNAVVSERATGLTGVPPLWIQLATLPWPPTVTDHLRYFANTGGRMPLETLKTLRGAFPKTKPFLMYGLTEAFRSTYLPPEEVDRRPDSIGKAIPNAEVLVLRPDGTECAPNEPGELVHRGPLVSLGYWNDPEKTAERFKPLPVGVAARESGLTIPERAVFSGDTLRRDEDGFLYFIGRRDEMIKTSGYRVSPVEIEEILYAISGIEEAAAFGVPHPALGQAIVAVVKVASGRPLGESDVLAACKEKLPIFMVPAKVECRAGPLPRNPNGKLDRTGLAKIWENTFVPGVP